MLPAKNRLRKREVERLYKKGHFLSLDIFVLRYVPNRAADYRFAVIVPKKTAAKAVERNRLRRKIYDILWEIKPAFVGETHDVSVTLKAKPAEEQLKSILENLFAKAGLKK